MVVDLRVERCRFGKATQNLSIMLCRHSGLLLNKQGARMWIQLAQGRGQMADSREHKKEPSCSVKNGEILD